MDEQTGESCSADQSHLPFCQEQDTVYMENKCEVNPAGDSDPLDAGFRGG